MNRKIEQIKVDEVINDHFIRLLEGRETLAAAEIAGETDGSNPLSSNGASAAATGMATGLANDLARCFGDALEGMQTHLAGQTETFNLALQQKVERLQATINDVKYLWGPVEQLLDRAVRSADGGRRRSQRIRRAQECRDRCVSRRESRDTHRDHGAVRGTDGAQNDGNRRHAPRIRDRGNTGPAGNGSTRIAPRGNQPGGCVGTRVHRSDPGEARYRGIATRTSAPAPDRQRQPFSPGCSRPETQSPLAKMP